MNTPLRKTRGLSPGVSGFIAPFLWVIFLTGGCSNTRSHLAIQQTIEGVLQEQARAWNQGDIELFMQSYWASADLTFSSGGKVTRGWQSTLEGYRRRYPTPEAMGQLEFDELEISPLSNRVALVLGRWHLNREEPIGGAFSLVMKKEKGRWLIIHDHTSRDAK